MDVQREYRPIETKFNQFVIRDYRNQSVDTVRFVDLGVHFLAAGDSFTRGVVSVSSWQTAVAGLL